MSSSSSRKTGNAQKVASEGETMDRAKNTISITNKYCRSQTIIGVVATLLLQTVVFDR
ncbi:hypothetical protein TcasGA2_TC010978 [Tribolium castaneum]|uniref:Uncharacterized protein n=1 Tax=Tribolium castaneum TaxID=7070 RepID=D6X1F9_TRICA|nr:hypothetical protein TcasGA2_TC010978 [Tribolium castaneum]